MHTVISCANRNTLTFSYTFCMPLMPFCCLIDLEIYGLYWIDRSCILHSNRVLYFRSRRIHGSMDRVWQWLHPKVCIHGRSHIIHTKAHCLVYHSGLWNESVAKASWSLQWSISGCEIYVYRIAQKTWKVILSQKWWLTNKFLFIRNTLKRLLIIITINSEKHMEKSNNNNNKKSNNITSN